MMRPVSMYVLKFQRPQDHRGQIKLPEMIKGTRGTELSASGTTPEKSIWLSCCLIRPTVKHSSGYVVRYILQPLLKLRVPTRLL